MFFTGRTESRQAVVQKKETERKKLNSYHIPVNYWPLSFKYSVNKTRAVVKEDEGIKERGRSLASIMVISSEKGALNQEKLG